jgi:hypothetical protein
VVAQVNQGLSTLQKINIVVTEIDTSLSNSVRMSHIVDDRSTKLDYLDHGVVIHDNSLMSLKTKPEELSFYLPTSKCFQTGVSTLTKYRVLIDEVCSRSDLYACPTSAPLLELSNQQAELKVHLQTMLVSLFHKLCFLNYGEPLACGKAPAPYEYARRLCEFNKEIVTSK